jgi:hypothetical protein
MRQLAREKRNGRTPIPAGPGAGGLFRPDLRPGGAKTSFTFQGTLQQSGVPLDGTPSLEFRLFDSTLAPVGPILSRPSWPVSNGH